jgi:hypothetical protein
MHFMMYCGGYATIRAKYSGLFGRARIKGGNDAQALRVLFGDTNQLELAYCVHEMLQHRQQVIEGHSSKGGKNCCLESAPERAPGQESSKVQEEEQEGISWLRNGKRYYLPADLGI